MLIMLIDLDTCCFNRPFDDQTQTRIRFETEAKLELQQRIREKKIGLVWSYVLDFELWPRCASAKRNRFWTKGAR